MLRLRQQISEKSRAVKSQVVTEEETCDQVRTFGEFSGPRDCISCGHYFFNYNMFLKQKCIILRKQISDMVADKQEEVAALEMKLQTLDKDLEWKKEVLSPIFLQSC